MVNPTSSFSVDTSMDSRCADSAWTIGIHTLPLQKRPSSSSSQLRLLRGRPNINHACASLNKLPGECWKTWIHHNLQSFTPHPHSHRMQSNEFPTFAHTNDNEVKEMSPRNMLQFLPCVLRALRLLGVGLGFSMPASARSVAPPVTTTFDSQGDMVHRQEEATKQEETVQEKLSTASLEQAHSNTPTQNPGMSTAHAIPVSAQSFEKHLHLSEAFWRGIPAQESSPFYRLKMQLDRYPSDAAALEVLLRAVLEQLDMLRALTVLETLLELQPYNLKWKFLKARTHEFLGDFFMAKMEYEELLSLRPLSARFLQGLVMLLNKLDEGTEALERIHTALNQAMQENKDVEARNLEMLLSQFYIQLGNFDNALQHLNKMIDEDPDDFRPYLCQGLAYTLLDDKDKAKQNFKKYMQLCPPGGLDQNHLDDLMLKVHSGKQMDALINAAMKDSSGKKKKLKPMKQPSFAGNIKPREEDEF